MITFAIIKDLVLGGGTVGGVAFTVWRLLVWWTGRVDKRQAQLDAEHSALDMSWKDYRLFLERDRRELREQMKTIENQNRALRLSFEHVAVALTRLDPNHPALAHAERNLRIAFGEDFMVVAAQAESALDRQQHDARQGGVE